MTNLTTECRWPPPVYPPKGVRIALGIVFAIVFLVVLGFIISGSWESTPSSESVGLGAQH